MKSAINAWSFPKEWDMETCFARAKASGFDGIELNVDKEGAHALTLQVTDAQLKDIRALSERYQLPVVSISTSLWGARMIDCSPEGIAYARTLLRCQLRCAKALGATGILIVPGGLTEEVSLPEAYEKNQATLRALRADIEEGGIFVGVENVWNAFFTSPFDMARFIDTLDIKYLGAYYDLGNSIAFSYTGHWVQVLGERIKNVHIKGYRRIKGPNSAGSFVDISASSVDWTRVMRLLAQTGFDGYITAEVSKYDAEQSYPDFFSQVANEIKQIIPKGEET